MALCALAMCVTILVKEGDTSPGYIRTLVISCVVFEVAVVPEESLENC